MKHALLLLATLSAITVSMPATAQNARIDSVDAARAQRPARDVSAVDVEVLTQRLRDRGVPDTDIAVSMERIRAWLAAGASPARIRAFLAGGHGTDRVVRPHVAERPVDTRPDRHGHARRQCCDDPSLR